MPAYDDIATHRDSTNEEHFIGELIAGTTIFGPRICGKHRLPPFISHF